MSALMALPSAYWRIVEGLGADHLAVVLRQLLPYLGLQESIPTVCVADRVTGAAATFVVTLGLTLLAS
jgi:hypothetical protein